jgi:hypothetical protein
VPLEKLKWRARPSLLGERAFHRETGRPSAIKLDVSFSESLCGNGAGIQREAIC